ncbi:MAG: flagellar hook-length control protein FliK [Rhodobacteraceae bacterium]|nr:flagellar hook-length control protein FliK [Paracoccaceae bacterium]
MDLGLEPAPDLFTAPAALNTANVENPAIRQEPALARHVAAQIAEIARPLPDRPVDLALNPEELGRIRLAFVIESGALSVLVHAERPETLDLLRRHIESLAQELRDIGYRDVSFGFGQGDGNTDAQGFGQFPGGGTSAEVEDSPDINTATEALHTAPLSADTSAGVDLRL